MRSFVDESGTPSRTYPLTEFYFVVVCITVSDESVLHQILADFRRDYGWSRYREIKFSELTPVQRLHLLNSIRQSEARVTAAVVDKRSIKTRVQELKSGELYRRSIALAISHSVREVPCDHVLIDNYFNAKPQNRHFISYLRQTINGEKRATSEKLVGDFGIGDSSRSSGLQAADLIVGAIAHPYNVGGEEYRRILLPNLEECYWP